MHTRGTLIWPILNNTRLLDQIKPSEKKANPRPLRILAHHRLPPQTAPFFHLPLPESSVPLSKAHTLTTAGREEKGKEK